MEEELNYSTVVFKNAARPPKETNEESSIYSTVKPEKGPANTAPSGEAAAHSQHFGPLPVCLGILCVLLLGSMIVIVYISVNMNEQKATLNNLMAQNQQLIANGSILQKQADSLNWTLGVILTFNTFPVNLYCPQKKCQPCQTGWIQFREKCYLFYNASAPWKTWSESQTYCQNTHADLVVIDSPREQEFVSNNTKFYYDNDHGYWLGLTQTANDKWVWVDGRNDTLGYWITQQLGTSGPCALMIPGSNVTANWDPADCKMRNKFICESEALIWSN